MTMRYFYINIDNDENLGLQAVSLVDRPAIETDFLKFKDQKMVFAKDESKHILTGPALIADMPIYRKNFRTGEEYYVIFTKDTIAKLVERYSKNNMLNSVNLQHDSATFTTGATLIESYFVDKTRGIAPKEFDIADGSWICSFKITDDALWEQIISTDEFNGFSVEVVANLEEKLGSEKQEDIDEIDRLIDELMEN